MDLAYHAYVVIVLTSFVIPEGQVTLNCTFEVDQCGWVQALDDDFDWTRQQSNTQTPHTGPSGDHTVGTGGYFMYIDNVSSYNRGDSARLMSPSVSLEANKPQCLTFWYHMHGAHIEKLNVYIADSNSLGDIKWTRLGTQGNAWLRGEMTIMASVNSTKMVVFEALHGIIHGDISIDDILLTRGACVPDFCNFEDMNSPLCDGTQDQSDDIDWSVSTGILGSPIDHTLGTVYGHYLYISATAQNTGKKAKYITSTFAGSSTLQCFQFYYTRSDEAIATFSVYIQVGGSQGSAVWSKSTSLGDGWFQAQITVDSESDFQVVFEAIRTSATSGYIGFDDFLVLNGNCASVGNLQGSCDFENGLCTWKNIYNDDIDWTENTGSTKTGSTGPQTDHTKGTADGVYMYLEASNVGEGVVSKLISAPYDANSQEDICLNFWYHMYGSDIGTLQVQQVTASGTTNLWTLSSDQGDEWINGQVGIHQDEDYQLVLNATRGQGTRGDISIDDISVTTGYCPIIYTPFDCDFELSVCGWTQASDDIFDFERHQGGTGSPHTGPSVDHTTGTVGGWYMFIDNSKDRDLGDAARLHSPEERFPANQAKCLIFWYHMYGAHIGTLNVYLKSGDMLGSAVWSRKTTYGDEWLQAKINIKYTSEVMRTIVIEATEGFKIHGDIAIDDVLLEDGYCIMDNKGCDFENGLCGGFLDKSGDFNWTLSMAGDDSMGPSLDKTYESQSGHYLLINATSKNTNKIARFATSMMTLDSDRCLLFYYATEGPALGGMDVRTKFGNTYSHPIWSRSFQLGDGWNIGLVSLRQQNNFQVVFEVLRGKGQSGYIALDDIQILDSDCSNPDDECNFEDGMCGWSNTIVGDSLDWVLLKGGTNTGGTGPTADHTTGLPSGTSLYLEGSNGATGAPAKLYSQIFLPEMRSRCLEFWYSMYGKNMGTLRIDVIPAGDANSLDTIWTLSGNQGDQWNYGRVPFFSSKEYQLVFVGILGTGSASDMAIDDIVISDGSCVGSPAEATVHPPTVAPPTPSGNPCGTGKFTCTNGACIDVSQYCDFVSDCTDNSDEVKCPTSCIFNLNLDCGWYEGTPDDNFNWHLGRGYDTEITPALAPRNDHTENTIYGYYQYIAPVGSYVYPYETAEYYSPRFSSAASGCVLDFWWYQNGLSPYYFEVWIVEDDVETKVFSYYNSMGDQWNHLIFGIGQQSRPWQVKFNKIRYSSYSGATAIDDLEFQNCTWPPPASFCDTSTKFWCTTTKACIDKNLVCDLQDDCGDYSDEINCGSYTQCDFQNVTCDWTQASGTDHLSWMLRTGSTPTTYTGPVYDHTYSNTSGYYLYIEGYYNYYGQTAQIVSPIYQATTNGQCKLRMFYHMYGQNIGRLTIYTRIYQNTNQGQTQVWQQIGENGPFWDRAEVTFSVTTDFQIVIEATAGDYYYGDIAIDDVTLTPGCIMKSGTLPTPPPTTPPPVPPSTTQHPACKPTEFYCSADNRCIAAEFICNFRDDCSDGEEEESRCVKPSCDFEDDSCGWIGVYEESSRRRRVPDVPQFRWDRQQGKTKLSTDFRPPKDKTLGTGEGFYLFADNSPGQYQDKAIVQTPMIGSTGADCHLQFYYHMGGTNVGSLQVLRLVGDGNSTLFTLSGVQGDEWKQGNVYIGAGQGYQILIQATRGSNYQGDECIDDVKFIDCAPPVLTGEPCQPSEFRCANTYCIDSNKVCNFVDECMDHSDEDQCDVQVGRCDFELDSCSWQQETGDEFDWSLFSGTTASIGTGPDTDHTIRSNKGHYVFIETSYPQKPADRARLASPTIKGTSSSNNCRITFWYHMYGIDIGSLAVLIRTSYEDDTNLEVVRNITGEQGNFWWQFSEVIDSGGKDFKIVLEGMVGSSYRGDIAIDDIIFSKECIAGGKLPGEDDASKPPHESCDDNPSRFKCDTGDKCFDSWERCNFKSECSDASDEKDCGKSCDFESGQCGWTNSVGDSFNWTRGHGPSWTTYTGPNTDHTYNTTKGHFMVLPTNTSYTYTGYKAHLQTLPFQRSGENCEMTFWYHMYGLYIGSLNVYIKYANHQSTKIWSMVGEQGNSWMEATIDIGQQEEFSILLEGVRGSSIYGDIGIDDIQFSNCGDSTFARPCEDGTEFKCVNDGSCIPLERYCDYRQDCDDMSDENKCVVKPGDCHFDDSNLLCDWIQYEDDDIDWVVAKTTPNDNTGPNHDHTTVNTTGNSQFLYVDSVKGSLSDIARISTPNSAIFPASKGVCVLRFWYHMYAVNENGVGGLRVYTESDVTTEQRALYWHVYGNQGNQWNYAKVTIGNPHPFKVVFEAIMGDSMSSDIAIDDVTFTASCYNPGNSTYPVPGSCPRNQFYCVGDSICIPNSWVNDGNIDCPTNCYDEDKYRFKCDSLQPQIGDKGTNVGVIAGGVVGGLIVAALIITLFIVFIKCRNQKGGASFQFNFGFGSKDDDKVRMSDLPDLDIPPQTGEEAYSIDNPVYSGKGSFDLPKSPDIEA